MCIRDSKCYNHNIWYKGFPSHTSLLATEVNELLQKMLDNNEIDKATFEKYNEHYKQIKELSKSMET